MDNDNIHEIVMHQAKLKCGDLWKDMNDKERNTAMLKVALIMLRDCFGGDDAKQHGSFFITNRFL